MHAALPDYGHGHHADNPCPHAANFRAKAGHKRTLKYITKSERAAELLEPPAAILPDQYRGRPHTYVKYLNGNRLPYKNCPAGETPLKRFDCLCSLFQHDHA